MVCKPMQLIILVGVLPLVHPVGYLGDINEVVRASGVHP